VDSRRLRYFVQIVDSGSITRAAAVTGVAQPALSQQLAVLENELKVKLLERSPFGVTPTAAGRILYARAQAILRQFDELRQAVHREVQPLSGEVMIGMSPTMVPRFAFALIEKVCTQHPEMHLQIREEGSAALNELLSNGRIELSISPTRPDNEAIVGDELLTEPVFVMYPPAWSVPDDAPLEALAALPWIVPRRPNSIRAIVDGVFAAASLTPYVAVELDSLHNVIETVRRGLGVGAMVAGAIQTDLDAGTLRARPLGSSSPLRPMFLARRRTPALSRPAQFVYDALLDIAVDLRAHEAAVEKAAR
jgi:LysR family transcriptional regulator, nitrogen assimilation regulatory protein